tara:strand:+ start:30618 stop:31811 length:1194 start_codon:yes stop_codon:yes gene_type:complete
MSYRRQFSSESVGEGHPDKVADYISDTVLDACLEQDPQSRVACEVLLKTNCVFISGEVTTKAKVDYDKIVRKAIREIGYVRDGEPFHADHVYINNTMSQQSPDIAQGVDACGAQGKETEEQGAGDQGIMFGYACSETPELMPAPIIFAHKLAQALAKARHSGNPSWLGPDCKTLVAVSYEGDTVTHVDSVVISTQHDEGVSLEEIRSFCIEEIIKKTLPSELLSDETQYLINPTGKFVIGGPEGDAGLTGRKIIVDTYGGAAHHGGGAFSGKDPSKVDRSAAYMCRWVAKNLVAAGFADKVELQISYAIGYPEPTSICVNTYGTGKYEEEAILGALNTVFSFKPADIVTQLNLLRPIYTKTTLYGHFTHQDLPWEQTDKVDALKKAIQSQNIAETVQ